MDATLLIALIERIQQQANNAHVEIGFYDESPRKVKIMRRFAPMANGSRMTDADFDTKYIMGTDTLRDFANIPLTE